jgi:DNA-binding MarR family transcriptional regulator
MDAAERALKRFGTAVTARAGDAFLDLNLTVAQMRVLRAIARLGRTSGRQLADELGVSPAAIVPVSDRLEAQGYLHRVRDTDDRRICWLELTPSGAALLDGLMARIRSRVRPALAKLPARDRQQLAAMLDELAEALEAPAGGRGSKIG